MEKHSDRWDLRYVAWREFRTAILEREGELWREMEDGDLVIGGMDFSIDFM